MTKSVLATTRPRWREPMLWLVVGGPALVVVACLATALLAWRGADLPLAEASAADPALQPAVRARNHAAAPR